MKKLLMGVVATAALATAAPAPAAASDCPTCGVREAADLVVDTTCHALWPTLYRLGYEECPA